MDIPIVRGIIFDIPGPPGLAITASEDADHGALTVVRAGEAANGQKPISPDGRVVHTPEENWNGVELTGDASGRIRVANG